VQEEEALCSHEHDHVEEGPNRRELY